MLLPGKHTVEDENEERNEERVIRAIRLQPTNKRQRVHADALGLDRSSETKIGDQDSDPVQNGKDSDETDEVVEYLRRVLARIQIAKGDEDG